MATNKDFIVAIELGSSKVTGIAGRKNLDGSISVLAIIREESSSFIRNGIVYKMDKTAQCVSSIVARLQTQLRTRINRVYVGVGGQSIHSERNVIVRDLPVVDMITQEMVDEIQEINRQMNYPGQFILDSVTQEYKVDTLQQIDPVGIQCRHLESHFLNILCREQFYNNLNECFNSAGIQIAELFLSPIALADSVLSDAEKRSGCVLVDLGADTTTVAIYHKNILRHLVVIPLGGMNITRDIASQHIEEHVAEDMKKKYGTAYSEFIDTNDAVQYNCGDEKTISNILFNEIVESRVREIVENVQNQIPKQYRDNLLGGLILTGGGSNMNDIEKAFAAYTGIQKIRIAKFVQQSVTSHLDDLSVHNSMLNTALAILAKGDMVCSGDVYNPNEELFNQEGESAVEMNNGSGSLFEVGGQTPRRSGSGFGVVVSAAEKEDIERKRAEAEEAERIAAEEAAAEAARLAQEEEEKRQAEQEAQEQADRLNNPKVSTFQKIKNWLNNLATEE
ncbi:MAG: cell division protein FtsA [Bacteroidaceae bacterium]|nr:cell division protein FtsA [Bacteroidaceae bacterium]